MRLDKWLWCARFFKTRSAATQAIAAGKVALNGARPKPAKEIKVHDQLELRHGPFRYRLRVLALAERRGPASAAALLYQESAESKQERAELAARLRAEAGQFSAPKRRPTKKSRREMERLRAQDWES